MAEEQITEQEVLDAVPEEETPPVAERPEYIPEKFWDVETGTPRVDELGKSYIQLEKFSSGKKEEIQEELMNELITEHQANVPENYELPALPDGITEEMVNANPLTEWWKNTAKENGLTQDEFDAGITQYVEVMQGNQPDIEGELAKLGENAQSRVESVDLWAQKTFPPNEYEALQLSLGLSADGIEALERIMEMQNSNIRSEQFTQPEKQLTLADARAMMSDKRYYDPKHRDDAFVKKVDAAFRMLTK
tara:strand:+ start:1004 stop:1750 length:747 start_codon:yes stop_codon:yes gene_type:complete